MPPQKNTKNGTAPGRTLAAAALLAATAAAIGAGACDTTYDFQPIVIGDDNADAPAPRSNTQFVRAAYADLLGRAPEVYDFAVKDANGAVIASFPVDEQTVLVEAMESVADPTPVRAIITAGLCASSEAALPDKNDVTDPRAYIADQFRRFLGRDPNAYELAAFAAEWDSDPAVGPKTILRALIGSREYQSQ